MFSILDPCTTTAPWNPAPELDCPDMCSGMGPHFDGNMADPVHKSQYVACWEGITVGCIRCPENLLYNEHHNACLYEGKYMTEPDRA